MNWRGTSDFIFTTTRVFACAIAFSYTSVKADSLSEIEFFQKCHTQLTQERSLTQDPLYQQVLTGAKTGGNACLEILELARLNPNSGLLLQLGNPKAHAVLRTFNDFHNSIFEAKDSSAVEDFARTAPNIVTTSFGHNVTRVLFTSNVPYRDLVTSNLTYEPIRTSSVNNRFLLHPSSTFISLDTGNYVTDEPNATGGGTRVPWSPRLLDVGARLDGVRVSDFSPIPHFWRNSAPYTSNVNLHGTLGGGVLGSYSYVFMNSGARLFQFFDGEQYVPRRWFVNVMNDLLCRSMPVVRPSDATNFIQPTSPISFRRGASCMQCHVSMDRGSGVVRNHILGKSSLGDFTSTEFPATFVAPVPLNSGTGYAFQTPNATFYLRDINGVLQNRGVVGANGFGAAIADTPDYYACAVRRYYENFLGVKIPLFDPGSPEAPTLNASDTAHLAEIKRLGNVLRANQSLIDILKEILKSPQYRQRQ